MTAITLPGALVDQVIAKSGERGTFTVDCTANDAWEVLNELRRRGYWTVGAPQWVIEYERRVALNDH